MTSSFTYYHDAKPILDGKCLMCHTTNGIGPFSYETYADVLPHVAAISSSVQSTIMPPWPPSSTCNQFAHPRTLTATEVSTLTSWIAQGAPAGDPSQTQPDIPSNYGSLSRIDQTLQMPMPYTPQLSPDDYRCFILDWTPTTTQYITGLGTIPQNPQIVHHAIAYLATPSQVAQYEMLDAQDPGPGYTCFGGPGGNSFSGWVGVWAPGAQGQDYPAGTGIPVTPGSKIILQIHYNLNNIPAGMMPPADQSSIVLKLDSTVQKKAMIIPFADPAWLNGQMQIPAGQSDVMHEFSADPTPFLSQLTNGVLPSNVPITIYSGGLHMHLHGSAATTDIQRAGGQDDCLTTIPKWDFHWQGLYEFAQPIQFNPGDQLHLQCHWNNSAAAQPIVGGVQQTPQDLNWGEKTTDEMCLGFYYVSP